MSALIAREQLIEQSVQERLRTMLFGAEPIGFAYNTTTVELLDAFDAKRFEGGEKNYVAAGFDFDDGGKQAECGSSLVQRAHTIELWVVGRTPTWGKNLSAMVKAAVEADLRIPLLDVGVTNKPVIDYLIVDEVQREHTPVADPKPWQENIWIVRLRVTDEYFARAAA